MLDTTHTRTLIHMCPRKLSTRYNSVTHITQYPVYMKLNIQNEFKNMCSVLSNIDNLIVHCTLFSRTHCVI